MAQLDDTSYLVRYVTGATPAARHISVGTKPGGALRVSANHLVNKLLPHMAVDPAAGNVTFTIHLFEYLIIGDTILTDQLDTGDTAFYAMPSWWTETFKNVATVGIDESPCSVPEARARFRVAMASLSPAQRTLDIQDVHMETTVSVGSWWDYITPRRLRASDDDNGILMQFRQMLPGFHVAANYNDEPFASRANDMIPMEKRTGSTDAAQASAVMLWLRATRPPSNMVPYLDWDEGGDEISRRQLPSDADKYRPLFERFWQDAFPSLQMIFEAGSAGNLVACSMEQALIRTSLGTELVDATAAAFVSRLTPGILRSLDVPSLTTADSIAARNATRLDAVITAVNAAKSTAARPAQTDGHDPTDVSGTPGAGTKKHTQDFDKVMASDAFSNLVHKLDSLKTEPLDEQAIFGACLSSPCAAGWLSIVGVTIGSVAQFDITTGLTTIKNIQTAHRAFQFALAHNQQGEHCPQWLNLIDEPTVKKIMHGKTANGDSNDCLNFWSTFEPAARRRDGDSHIDELAKTNVIASKAAALFLSADHMEAIAEPIYATFAMLGYTGSGTGTPRGVWRNIISRSKSLFKLPRTDTRRLGLMVQHVAACSLIFEEWAGKIKAMIATPVAYASKPPQIFQASGRAADAWKYVGQILEKLQDDAELETSGLSKHHHHADLPISKMIENIPEQLRKTTAGAAVSAFFATGDAGKIVTGAKRLRDDQGSWQAGKNRNAASYTDSGVTIPAHVDSSWGMAAHVNGIYQSGRTIFFGDSNATTVHDGAPMPNPKIDCLACWAPHGSPQGRSKWCSKPHVCVASNGHPRPAGLEGAFTPYVGRPADLPAKPADAITLFRPAVPSTNNAAGPSRWQTAPARGKGGRGKGRGPFAATPFKGGKAIGKAQKGAGAKGKGRRGQSQGRGGGSPFGGQW